MADEHASYKRTDRAGDVSECVVGTLGRRSKARKRHREHSDGDDEKVFNVRTRIKHNAGSSKKTADNTADGTAAQDAAAGKAPRTLVPARNARKADECHVGDPKTARIGGAVYDIIRVLGSGGFGKCFLARDRRETSLMSAFRVCKAVPHGKNDTHNHAMPCTGMHEAMLLGFCSHENIVRCFAHECLTSTRSGNASNVCWIVLEYCIFGDMDRYIHQRMDVSTDPCENVLPEKTVLLACHQVLSAVEYLHRKRIVHRDIKPGNVLIYNNRTLKLCDMGLSRRWTTQRKGSKYAFLRSFAGTPKYMAPEVVRREVYGIQVDIWSCAVLACFFLKGVNPFYRKGDSRTMIKKRITRGRMYDCFGVGGGCEGDGGCCCEHNGTASCGTTNVCVVRAFMAYGMKMNPDDRPRAGEMLDFIEKYVDVKGDCMRLPGIPMA